MQLHEMPAVVRLRHHDYNVCIQGQYFYLFNGVHSLYWLSGKYNLDFKTMCIDLIDKGQYSNGYVTVTTI